MRLWLKFPDGSAQLLDKPIVLGRGNPAVLDDPQLSRQHFSLSPAEDLQGFAYLRSVGLNPVVVESRNAHDQWEAISCLGAEDDAILVGPQFRFYVATKQASTMITLELAPASNPSWDAAEATVDLTEDDPPPAKRSRLDVGRNDAGRVPSMWEAPFSLFWVRGLPDAYNTGCLGARLRELVAGPLKLVLAANYMVDMGWLLSACPALIQAQPLVLVHGERDPALEADIRAMAAAAGVRDLVVFKPHLPDAFGTHHSKMFLLQYETGVRVIVHTANLILPDCNNKTQGLWYQDFPLKVTSAADSGSQFEHDLADYLQAYNIPNPAGHRLLEIVCAHDFSSARAHLIASVPGYHKGSDGAAGSARQQGAGPASACQGSGKASRRGGSKPLCAYGHMRLRALLSKEEFPAALLAPEAQLIAQCSSLGSLSQKWLLGEFCISMATHRRPAGLLHHTPQQLKPSQLRIVWPTVKEVRESLEGWAAGFSIPGPPDNVTKPFLQPHWAQWGGHLVGRQRAMPHIKTYTRYIGQQVLWCMVGSHNLSMAAWGQLQLKGTQLFIRSYELSVLLVPSLEERYRAHPHCGFSCTPHAPPATHTFGSLGAAAGGGGAAATRAAAAADAPAATPAAADLQEAGPSWSDVGSPGAIGLASRGPMTVQFWTMASYGGQQQQQQGRPDEQQEPSSSVDGGNLVRMYLPLPYQLPPPLYYAPHEHESVKPWRIGQSRDGRVTVHEGWDAFNLLWGECQRKYYGNVEPD